MPKFLYTLMIHIRAATFVALLVPTIALLSCLTKTPIYQSNARLLIESKDIGFKQFRPLPSVGYLSDPVETQLEILRSDIILKFALKLLKKAYKKEPSKIQLFDIATLAGKIAIERERGTDVIVINFKDTDKKRAKNCLKAIISSYITKTQEIKTSDINETIAFLKKERNKMRKELENTGKELLKFESQNISIPLEAEPEIVRLALAIKELEIRSAAEQAKIKATSDQLAKQLMISVDEAIFENTLNSDPFLSKVREDLYDKESKLIQLKTIVKPEHFKLKELIEQIEGDKILIRKRIQELTGSKEPPTALVYGEDPFRAELAKKFWNSKASEFSINEEQKVLYNAKTQLEKTLSSLPKEKYIHTQLFIIREEALKTIADINQKLRESRIEEIIASNTTNIRVIDPPSLPKNQIEPNIMRSLFVNIILGLFLAAVVVYTAEYFDDIIRGKSTLPKDMNTPLMGELSLVTMGDLPMAFREPKSQYVEEMHVIRANIPHLAPAGNDKCILITSPYIGEGKSTTASNLAITIAKAGKRVLLVDGDMRRPALHKIVGSPREAAGLSTVLIGQNKVEEVIQKNILGIEGFDLLPAGNISPNPIQLLESINMKELIETTKLIYDTVIIDSTPMILLSDAIITAKHADVILVVSRVNRTYRKDLMHTLEQLKNVNKTQIGVVLNAIASSTEGYKYHNYYTYKPYEEEEKENKPPNEINRVGYSKPLKFRK